MGDDKIVEQPKTADVIDADAVLNSDEKKGDGSTLGKFKDATSLLSAYNSLQSEFTRKSQRLSELEKLLEEKNKPVQLADDDSVGSNEKEHVLTENNEEEKQQYKQMVDDFFLQHADAGAYAKDMAKILSDNKFLTKNKNGVEIAYRLAKGQRMEEPASLAQNPKFLEEYIYSDSKIKDKFIRDYLLEVENSKNSYPKFALSGTKIARTLSKDKISSLEEANDIFSKMLTGKY